VSNKYTRTAKTVKSGKTNFDKLELAFADRHTDWSDVKCIKLP
jgi:hypothetical protein